MADPRVDPAANENEAIRWASRYGHTETVRLLLADPRVDPTVNDNNPIRWASENGHTDVVRLLLFHGASPQTKEQEKFRHNLIRDQAIVLNQLPYGPYGRLPALITCTILSFVYKVEIPELYDDMAKIKKSVEKIKYEL